MGGVAGTNGEGEGGKKRKKGKKRKREKEGGTFRVPGELLFRIREALGAGDDGDDGDDGNDEGDKCVDKGERGDKGGEKEVDTGVRRGVPGARMSPGKPPPRRKGVTCVSRRANGGLGGAGGLIRLTGLIGLTHHQVTRRRHAKLPSKWPMGCGGALTGLTGGWGGENPVLRESGPASGPCDWPLLAMGRGSFSLSSGGAFIYIVLAAF